MNRQENFTFWVSASWSLTSTILNLVTVLWIPQDRISFAVGLGGFLFCILGHMAFIASALWVAANHQMKKWPMWLNLIHPIFALIGFLVVNWEKVRERQGAPAN